MIVERYQSDHAAIWDDFVRSSRNGTFQFERGYMDYHSERFSDHSLLIFDEGELISVLPAHAIGDRISSHGGLSFGGFIVAGGMKAATMLGVFDATLSLLQTNGLSELTYKSIPHIYHRQSAEEDRYALFLLDAQVVRRDLLSVVPRADRLPYQQRRRRGAKKANDAGVDIREERDLDEFWGLLASHLAERFDTMPVHTLAEISLLKQRFPQNIRLFTARLGKLLAGVVIYESSQVAHCQYIAANSEGQATSALDVLFDRLLVGVYCDHPYFDFGSSHEDNRRAVVAGLIDQKEGFGARAVVQETYRVDLATFRPGILTGAMR